MPYITCSCLIFQALGSLFPSLYSFPVTPILSYSFLASNLSFFPLLAPDFYYYTQGEDREREIQHSSKKAFTGSQRTKLHILQAYCFLFKNGVLPVF